MIIAGIIFCDVRGVFAAADSSGEESRGKSRSLTPTIYYWIVIAALIFLAGLRYHNGIDTIMYNWNMDIGPSLSQLVYEKQTISLFNRHDWLFAAVRECGGGIWVIQLLFAIIVNVSVGFFFARYCANRFSALLLYFIIAYFNLNFEVLREGAAVAIFLWAFPDLLKRRRLHYYLKVLLAMLMHLSASILLFLPLLSVPAIQKVLTGAKSRLILVAASFVLCFCVAKSLAVLGEVAVNEHFPVDFYPHLIFKLKLYANSELGASLNWRGYLGIGLAYVVYPLLFSTLILRKEGDVNRYMGMLMALAAIIGAASLGIFSVKRMENYFVLFMIVGMVRCCPLAVAHGGRWKWWVLVIPLLAYHLNTFRAPIKDMEHGRVYNLYYPYTNLIDCNTYNGADSLWLELRSIHYPAEYYYDSISHSGGERYSFEEFRKHEREIMMKKVAKWYGSASSDSSVNHGSERKGVEK